MAVSPAEFRRALGHFASSVTVVTARAGDGTPLGITVTAFTSLSLEPPLVLICIDRRSRIHDQMHEGGYFAVNFLAEEQELVSRSFATHDPDPFLSIGHRSGATGAPLLVDTLTAVECRIVSLLPGGDHTIFVGEVEATEVRDAKPLLYFRGGYNRLA